MRLAISGATVLLLAVGTVPAATRQAGVELGAFIGTWKENTAKSRAFVSRALTYTFSQASDGFVVIVRGGVQLRDRVRLDGKDYPTPDIPGRTVSWTKVGDAVYETTIKRDGALGAKGRNDDFSRGARTADLASDDVARAHAHA